METMTVPRALEVARRLPLEAQLELAERLLRDIRLPRVKQIPKTRRTLGALDGLSDEELQSLADAAVAPNRQQQLRALLRKNREQTLTPAEQTALDQLLAESDRIALLKARALYTLVQRGKNGNRVKRAGRAYRLNCAAKSVRLLTSVANIARAPNR